MITQDINQLYPHYGRDEAITSTCHVQCAFAPNRIETAEHLSKLTGQTTVVKERITTSGRGWSTNVSRSTHEVSRPLLTPDEAMRMKGARKNAQGMITEAGNMILYVAGYHGPTASVLPRSRAGPAGTIGGRVRSNQKNADTGYRQRIKRQRKTRIIYRFAAETRVVRSNRRTAQRADQAKSNQRCSRNPPAMK